MTRTPGQIAPLQWSLPQLSAAQIRLEARVRAMLPDPALRGHVLQSVHQTMVKYLGPEAIILPEGLNSTTYGELLARQGDQIVLLVMAIAPHGTPLYVQCDRDVAGAIVDRLLGGRGDVADVLLPLTDAEQGCMQFFALHCAAALHAALGTDAPWYVRCEQLVARRGPAEQLLPPHQSLVQWTCRVGLGDRLGAVRILLPADTIQAVADATVAAQPALTAEQLLRVGSDRVQVYADAGMCELRVDDLASLAPGDVVLLDRATVQLTPNGVAGAVVLRTATSDAGISCTIERGHCVVTAE